MMIAALLALAAGAVAGIFLATRHFLRKRLPVSVALLHGLGGATGFTLVLLAVVREPTFRPIRDVLYLLIATVVLGAVNLLFHIRKVRHRTSLILLHGFTAVTSAAMLIRAIVVHEPPAPPSVAGAAGQPAKVSAPELGKTEAVGDGAAAPESAVAQGEGPDAAADVPAQPTSDEFVVPDDVRQALERPINFETKSAAIGQDSATVIGDIASALKAHPEITLIEVQGHADERGDDSRNVELTFARAAAVVNALQASGVPRERLHSAGYGARCPVDAECRQTNAPESCHAPENWQRDRRVVFLVLQVGKAAFKGEVACARGVSLIPAADRRFHVPDAKP